MFGTLIFEQWDDVKAIGREARVLLRGKNCPIKLHQSEEKALL
jgi:hypothetical protein